MLAVDVLTQPLFVVWLLAVRFVNVPLIEVAFVALSASPERFPAASMLVRVQSYVTPATTGKFIVLNAVPLQTNCVAGVAAKTGFG